MPHECPFCGADFRGLAIPPDSISYYLTNDPEPIQVATHFLRVHSFTRSDRTVAWGCPDCKDTWERQPGTVSLAGTFRFTN